jgi:hypothetical protein
MFLGIVFYSVEVRTDLSSALITSLPSQQITRVPAVFYKRRKKKEILMRPIQLGGICHFGGAAVGAVPPAMRPVRLFERPASFTT